MNEWKGPVRCDRCGRVYEIPVLAHYDRESLCEGSLLPYDRRAPDPEKQKLVEQLADCVCQIEYLHAKFQETGSGNTTLVRSRALLRPYF